MKNLKLNFNIVMSCLIALSLTLTTVDLFGQKSDSTKKEALKKIKAILKETTYNGGGVKKIYRIAKRAKFNFDIYVHTADLAHEFGYNTLDLVTIAKLASKSKCESTYFNEFADLLMMRGGEDIITYADTMSKMNNINSVEIEKKIQEFKNTAKYKTMADAKAANKINIDRILKKE